MQFAHLGAQLVFDTTGSIAAFSTEHRQILRSETSDRTEVDEQGQGNAADSSEDRQADDGQDQASDSGENDKRTIAEWTTLGVSALFVALLIGAALYEHFARDEPPGVHVAVELALDRAEVRDGLSYIPFTVVNTGADPAENVVVLFEIKKGGETVEESTTEIAFLPNSGSAEGELVTALNLGSHTVEARVATLQHP